jgi:hypothetical protein
MAEEMVDAVDLQRDILTEAARTGTESGRSVCGESSNAKEGVERERNSVVLKGCPLNARGLMHGGGGHDFAAPEHSLLDMANVVFGAGAASMVVGNEQSDLMLSVPDEHQGELIHEFQNALGVEVQSTDDVLGALQSGEISYPAQARRRFRKAVPKLFLEIDTPHPDISPAARARAVVPDSVVLEDALAAHRNRIDNIAAGLETFVGQNVRFDPEDVNINIAQVLTSQLTDAVVLMFFLYLLGGSPRTLVRRNVPAEA